MTDVIRKMNEIMELQEILNYINKQKTKDIIDEKNTNIMNKQEEIIGIQYIIKNSTGVVNIFEIKKNKDKLALYHRYINPNQDLSYDDDEIY